MNLDALDIEEHGRICLDQMEQALLYRRPGAVREALENAAAFLLIAREQLPAGTHEPGIVTQVAARIRTLKYAAA